MKHVFIVATEHHLFQVQAAIQHFSLNKDSIILVVMKLPHDSINETCVKRYAEFSKIYFFDSWVFADIALGRRKHNKFIDFCLNLRKYHDQITLYHSQYSSDPDLLFLSILQPKKSFLMDEGAASFGVVRKRMPNSKKYLKLYLKSILYKVNISIPTSITYFTKYDLRCGSNDSIEKYDIKQIDNPLKSFDYSKAIFIGSSIVEVGLMKEKKYTELLIRVRKNHADKKWLYYAHRKENSIKLKKIESLGFEIVRLNIPFETMFSSLVESPALFCSFFTTGVLNNISEQYANIPELTIYKFDTALLRYVKEVYDDIFFSMEKNKRLKFKLI